MHVDATVLKDEVLRLADIPLVIKLPGMPQVARGSQVKLDMLRWDEVDLTVEARVLDIVQQAGADAIEELDEDMGDDLLEADAEPVPANAPQTDAATNAADGEVPVASATATPE